MASKIRIHRSTGASAPSSLEFGELAATVEQGTAGNSANKAGRLFIGNVAGNPVEIGGEYTYKLLDHTPGELHLSSALITDANANINGLRIAGIATITRTDITDTVTQNLRVTGVGTFVAGLDLNGNVTIGNQHTDILTINSRTGVSTDMTLNNGLKVVGLSTFSNAVDINSTTTLGDDVTFETANGNNIVFDKSANDFQFGDAVIASFGNSQDLRIYHDYSGGSENSHIYQTTNKHLLISAYTQFARVNGTWGVLNLGNSHNMLRATAGSDVKLYFNNTERITTTGYGATIAGITSATSFTASESGVNGEYLRNQIKWDRNSYNYIDCTNDSGQFAIRMGSSQTAAFSIDTSADTIFPTNRKIKMSSDKLQLYHDGSHGYVKETNGDLYLQSTADDIIIRAADNISIQAQGGEYCINGNGNGSVDLYYDGGTYTTPKLSTTATGITVDGEVAASQDYPTIRPTLDFNFAAEKKLDPRIVYYRTGPASYHDEFGKVVIVSENVPRFDHTFPEYWDEGNLGDSNSKGISK